MSREWCSPLPDGVRLAVQVQPNARKTEVLGLLDGALKIKLQAQPVEGKANEALVRWLADALKVPKSAVTVTHGHSARRKLLEIRAGGVTPESLARLLPAGGEP